MVYFPLLPLFVVVCVKSAGIVGKHSASFGDSDACTELVVGVDSSMYSSYQLETHRRRGVPTRALVHISQDLE